MTSLTLKKWLLAELSADPILAALLPSPGLWSSDEEFPSKTGVYVGMTQQTSPGPWTDGASFRLTCFKVGETPSLGESGCYDMAQAVFNVLDKQAGLGKDWYVDPATLGLRVKSLLFKTMTSPARDGEAATAYRAELLYEFVGHDDTRHPVT